MQKLKRSYFSALFAVGVSLLACESSFAARAGGRVPQGMSQFSIEFDPAQIPAPQLGDPQPSYDVNSCVEEDLELSGGSELATQNPAPPAPGGGGVIPGLVEFCATGCAPTPCGSYVITSVTAANAKGKTTGSNCPLGWGFVTWDHVASRVAAAILAKSPINIGCAPNIYGGTCSCQNITSQPFSTTIKLSIPGAPPGYPSCTFIVTADFTFTGTKNIGTCKK